MAEQWLPAVGYEGRYEVSNLGRVRSLARIESTRIGPRSIKGGFLKSRPNVDGYPHVPLRIGGKLRLVTVHRLVCRAFHGEPTRLHNEVAHLDGNRANARADNLKWASKVENRNHRKLHGTECHGEQHASSKLTREAVEVIRAIPKRCADLKALAKRYGVSWRTISSIRSGKGWRHLSGHQLSQEER